MYVKNNGKEIKNKYFKSFDQINNTINVGFYKHDRKNYSESLGNIKSVLIKDEKSGGNEDSQLKETILLSKEQWTDMRRDMVISYKKKDGKYIYRVKYNGTIKKPGKPTKYSFTTETGFNYMTKPENIELIYRHISTNDKTITMLIQTIRSLENRIKNLEKHIKPKQ